MYLFSGTIFFRLLNGLINCFNNIKMDLGKIILLIMRTIEKLSTWIIGIISPILIFLIFYTIAFFTIKITKDEYKQEIKQPKQITKKEVIKNYEKYCLFLDSLSYVKKSQRERLQDSVSKYYKLSFID